MITETTIDVDGAALPLRTTGATDGTAPAVVVVPSIFGPTDELLQRLASLPDPTLVVVPDPFFRTGEGPLPYDDLDGAIARLGEFDRTRCGQEMAAAADWARDKGNGRVVGLGICFGGPFVLRLAATGHIDGLVTWHGSGMERGLGRAASIACPVRHHVGDADAITPPDVIAALRDAFAEHADAEVIVHEGADHGFSHAGPTFDETAAAAGLASVADLLRV